MAPRVLADRAPPTVDAGRGGSGGGTGDAGPTGDSGSTACTAMGKAVSLASNTVGGNDAAKARVEIDMGTDLPTGNTNRTIEFWAFVPSAAWVGNVNSMFFYGGDNRSKNEAAGFGLDFGGQKGSLDPFTNAFFDNDDQPTGLSTSADAWVHFAMTWDGTSVRAFVNGVVKSTKTSTNPSTLATTSTVFTLGGYPMENAYFNGAFDELRIWKVARSAAEITASMKTILSGNETGLVGYWKFDETSGTTRRRLGHLTAGHTPHPGTLKASSAAMNPTWIAGMPMLTCP